MMSNETVMERLNEFWALIVSVWNTGVFGADLGSILTALGIILLSWILRRAFSVWVIGFVRRFTRKTATQLDDAVLNTIQGPMKFLFIVLGIFFASQVLPLSEEWDMRAEQLVRSLLLIVFFWAFYNMVGPIVKVLSMRVSLLRGAIGDWFERGLKLIVVLLGVAGTLENFGIPVAPIIGGLGLFGVAVALGAQDLFKNLIAGVLILTERRFRKGDWILVDGVVEGTVENIGFRSTKVRRFDKAPVQVPNAQLSDNPVTNFSEMTFRRIYWHIGVTYSTTIDQLRQIRDEMEDYLLTSGDFAKPTEAATFVRIDRFNNSSIDLMLYCFTRTTVWGEWLEVKERLAYRLMEIVEGAGSSFAFPSQSLYVEQVPGERPEMFMPPKTGGGPCVNKPSTDGQRDELPVEKKAARSSAKEAPSKTVD